MELTNTFDFIRHSTFFRKHVFKFESKLSQRSSLPEREREREREGERKNKDDVKRQILVSLGTHYYHRLLGSLRPVAFNKGMSKS